MRRPLSTTAALVRGLPIQVWGTADIQLQGYVPAPFLGDTCETADEVQLDEQLTTQINLPAAGGISGWIRLAGAVGRSYDFVLNGLGLSDAPYFSESDRSALSLCDSCDPAATCVAIQSGITQTLFITQGSVMHLQNIDARADTIASQAGMGLWFQPVQGGADQ